MKHKKLRKILLSLSLLSLIPFADACSNGDSSEDSHRRAIPKFILEGTKDDTASESHSYLDYYTITSSEVAGVTGYAVALKDGADPASIEIPAAYGSGDDAVDVVGIMPYGFRDASATTITFDGEIQIIDYEAFLGSKIKNINVPWSIKEIGDGAFYDCQSLQTVRFNSTDQSSTDSAIQCPCEGNSCEVTTGTSTADSRPCTLTNIPQFCFFNCRSLTTLTLPASITEIEYEAFNGCGALNSTLFFQNIKTIRARAFQGCTSLEAVYIPDSFFSTTGGVGVIEPLAFNYCSSTLQFEFYTTTTKYNTWFETHPDWNRYKETDNASRYTVGNTVTVHNDAANMVVDTDWSYQIEGMKNGETGVRIMKFMGTLSQEKFLVVPNELGGQPVRCIQKTAFDTIKSGLERLYLPTTLYSIENEMFGTDYPILIVVDSRDNCSKDWDSVNKTSKTNLTKRIDLSHLVELQFIGYWAFSKMTKINEITNLHLPANLIAIGNEAFCVFANNHMSKAVEFLWDFDESTSRLEVIGTDAFWKLGSDNGNTDKYNNDKYNKLIQPTTIVFPKSFKHFGMIDADINEYKTRTDKHMSFTFQKKGNKAARPAHCFANCPLIGNVIFKGSDMATVDTNGVDNTTNDLVIPLQTFVYNENLQRIIFEERVGHFISFHTQHGNYAQQCIGANGVESASFRGRPFLQTIVLPTKYTKLYIQRLAFQGNPRAAMYLSGSYGNDNDGVEKAGMYYDNHYTNKDGQAWTDLIFTPQLDLESATQWRTIGNEDWYDGDQTDKYMGYCFTTSETTQDNGADKNKFYLDQKIPYYENVHFKMSFTVKAYVVVNDKGEDKTTTVTAEVGEKSSSSLEYVEQNDFAYLCGGTDIDTTDNNKVVDKAIMTKYLYRLWPNGDDTDKDNNRNIKTVDVAKTVTGTLDNPGKTYTVTEIGASAFSAAHCNGKVDNNKDSENDLEHVRLPNTIKKIGEYAFMRAYGVKKISAYSSTPSGATDYNMPAALEYVGKNAFSFCNVEEFLNFPDDCFFYENTVSDYETTSVFTNNFSLRKITFKHGNNSNSKESNNYATSTYGSEYTTALYSKNSVYDDGDENTTDTAHNPNRLLIILNRAKASFNTGCDNTGVQDFTRLTLPDESTDTLPTFKVPSPYNANPFLYGAYKMAYWIKQADIGYCTTSTGNVARNRGDILNQPLFSGICSRSKNGNPTDEKLKIGVKAKNYVDIGSDLEKASGEMFDMPNYGFNGCENLKTIHLPDRNGGVLPDGLFANVTATDLKYSTDDGSSDAGFLDLTGTGYAEIGSETFKKNLSITKIKAPAVTTFTIDANAFDGCTNLEELDLSPVTESVTIKSGAFNGCSRLTTLSLKGVTSSVTFESDCFNGAAINSITWPDDTTATISIGERAFESGLGSSLTTLTLPAKTTSLGKDCFKNCTSLGTVAFAGDNTDITSIGEGSFYGCEALNSFDFAHLKSLTTIGKSSFNGAGTIRPNGIIEFDSGIVTFGETAFKNSKLVVVTFTCSSITLNTGAFSYITTLEKVRFSNHNCSWAEGKGAGAFSGCTALTDLQLPTGFNLNVQGLASMIEDDTNVHLHLYCYHTYDVQSPTTDWRKTNTTTQAMKEPCYYVGALEDVTKAATLSTGEITHPTIEFWTLYNGEAKYLGTITSASENLVKFSEGWQMDNNGNVSQTPAP